MKFNTISTFGLSVLAGISLVTPASAAEISIPFVLVGDVNNPKDPATGNLYGQVTYAYKIAKYETTIAQYAKFLNAVAKTDLYGLYSPDMTDKLINGIIRSGVSGSYTYVVSPGSGNKPITYVSWPDAARFCNWLHNGQQTGLGAALSAEKGAYELNGAISGIIRKRANAKFWIPSQNEWYKAAYYDPNKEGLGLGGYWKHATRSDTLAGNTIGIAKSANYYDGDYVGSGTASPPIMKALTNVGAYGLSSESAYGTSDQSGNVWEWNDAVISGSWRGLRGGAWDRVLSDTLRSSGRGPSGPADGGSTVGFRVASVP